MKLKGVTFLITLILTAATIAQDHPLPLRVVSISASFIDDLLAETEYDTLSDGEKVPLVIGLRYGIKIEFEVEDTSFVHNPSFIIYASTWNNQIHWIEIDSTMTESDCGNCLRVGFEIDVDTPGWLDLYCLPVSSGISAESVWALKNGTDVQKSVYLR